MSIHDATIRKQAQVAQTAARALRQAACSILHLRHDTKEDQEQAELLLKMSAYRKEQSEKFRSML